MNNKGWVKSYRDLFDWEWLSDDAIFRFFILCVLDANIEDGRFMGLTIKRGQFVTSYEQLSIRFKMSKNKIRRCIEQLKKTGEIKVESTPRFTIITVCNYEKYQSASYPSQIRTVSVTDTQSDTLLDTQLGHNQRNKEIKNSIKERDSISYPNYTEVKAYADERGASEELALDFFEHYESNGWMVGKNPMKNWKASFNGWMRRHKKDDDPEEKEVTMNVL